MWEDMRSFILLGLVSVFSFAETKDIGKSKYICILFHIYFLYLYYLSALSKKHVPKYFFVHLGYLPSFSLIKERSQNIVNPLVEVTFADGSSDFLILSKYENRDGHFIGHLENEPTACVAMVNHPEHAELTIMSNR